ncbi:MAG TPA: 30S ribosome-binding factor RbfA [Candidatus Avirikenella pullistercoris]|nr:30S ribosome-binding factor RbfA [Candidatus Avirikenella pullistercoris]
MEAESTRAQKIARQIQRDMSEILQKEASALARGTMVSVTVVRMSPDLSLAKIYLSVFPFDKHAEILENIKKNAWSLRMSLAKRMKNQIKSIPEVAFFLDDSMEYADNIDSILKRSL